MPIVASPQELASARPIVNNASGEVAAGTRAFFRVDLKTEELLVATLHAPGATTRLTLLDVLGRELNRSEGLSTTDRDDVIAQHLAAGTDYLEVESLGGAGRFDLSTSLVNGSRANLSSIGPDVSSLAVADLNGDGRPDLAVGTDHGVEVLLGTGDGTFGPPATYLPGAGVTALAVADLNGDGRPDLAVGTETFDANGTPTGDKLEVLLGSGDGTFGPPAAYLVGAGINLLAVADLNGDGRPDLAVGTLGGGLEVLLGTGDGTFGPPATYLPGALINSLVTADFNGDGRPDLAVATETFDENGNPTGSKLEVLLGSGDGTFGPPATYLAGVDVTSLAVADLNGDGRPDLAVGTSGGGLEVLLETGDGTFGPPATYLPGAFINSLATADFNGDGRPDLAVGTDDGVEVLLGAGDGTFGPPATSTAGAGVNSLAVADLNGDGRPDLAVVNDQGVEVLLGAGDGAFGPPATYLAGAFATSLAVADLNGDGRPDLAVGTDSGVEVLLGAGDGTFGPPASYLAGALVNSLAVADLNGDGRPDLVVGTDTPDANGNVAGGNLEVLLGAGDGTFGPPATYPDGDFVRSLAVADLNGDGRPDLVVGTDTFDVNGIFNGGKLEVLLGSGDGTFGPPAAYLAGGGVASLAVADLNGDGRPDLVVATDTFDENGNPTGSKLEVLLRSGDGTFGPPATYLAGAVVTSLAVADLNGDGRPDLAVGTDNGVKVLLGAGDGTFGPPATYLPGAFVTSLVTSYFNGDGQPETADFNHDGRPDLAVATNNGVEVLLGAGDGTFGPPATYLAKTFVNSLAVADLNGDGRLDLATSVGALLNTGSGSFAGPQALAAGIHANPLIVDAAGDLAVVDQDGNILLRRRLASLDGGYAPPTTINPGAPALDIAALSNGGDELIAAADSRDNLVRLYRRVGADFVPAGTLATGALPAQVVAGDVNGDGLPDLVVRDAGDGTASVFLGLPGGGFAAMPSVAIGLGASSIALADVDGSGRISLVVTNQVTGDVRVYPGLGDGTFGQPSRYQAGAGPYTQAIAADGSSDLASDEETAGVAVGPLAAGAAPSLVTINPGSNTLAVLQGLGGGDFANARVARSGGTPSLPFGIDSARVVRLADLSGNGVGDLILLGANGVTVYVGDGRGGFRPLPTIPVGPDPTGLTVADVDGDGKLDLLVGNGFGDVLVLRGDGDGTFQPFRSSDQKIALAVADLAGNGQQDFIFVDQERNRVTVQYPFVGPVGPGGTGVTQHLVADQSQGLLAPGAVALANLTVDGKVTPYLVVANSGSNDVLVYPGLGNGQFGPAINGGQGFFTGTNPVGVTVAYFNNDGIPDLVVADKGSNDVSILLGQLQADGRLTFVPGERLKAGLGPTATGPTATVVMQLPGDKFPEILVSDSLANQVAVIPGASPGLFNDQSLRTIPVGTDPGPLFVGNFTGRPGQLDLVTVNAGSNDLTLVADFEAGGVVQSIPSGGLDPVAALAGDFTGDGTTDLLVANAGDGTLALFLGGLGELTFDGSISNPDLPHPTTLALDAISGSVLQFYAGTQGREAATLLAFNLGGEAGVGEPIVEPPATTAAVQQVAKLQPLGGSSSLALVAVLTTVSVEAETAAVEETVAVVPGQAGALPNQPPDHDDPIEAPSDEDEAPDPEDTPASPASPPGTLSPLLRFFYGLDDAFERVRSDAHRGVPTSHRTGAGRAMIAWDAALDRWSPVLAGLDPTAHALARLGAPAADLLETALQAISIERSGAPPVDLGPPVEPPGVSPSPEDALLPLASATALWLSCQARATGSATRRGAPLSTPTPLGFRPGGGRPDR
jgi:hypothetical protein